MFSFSGFDGKALDIVRIVVIHEVNIFMAPFGSYRKAPWEIGTDEIFQFVEGKTERSHIAVAIQGLSWWF